MPTTTYNQSISYGNFRRGWRLLFVFALAAAWLGQARVFHSTTAVSAAAASEVSLRGQEAIDQLKKEGAYESLSAAVAAAGGQTVQGRLANQSKLTAGDGAQSDDFGNAVAISGDNVAIGAFLDDVTGTNQGSVYVFVRSDGCGGGRDRVLRASCNRRTVLPPALHGGSGIQPPFHGGIGDGRRVQDVFAADHGFGRGCGGLFRSLRCG
jgi:hypothetical protein